MPSVPSPIWWLVNRFLLDNPGVGTLESIVGSGVDTLLVCGPDDLLPISLGSEGRVRRMESPNISGWWCWTSSIIPRGRVPTQADDRGADRHYWHVIDLPGPTARPRI